MSRFIWTKVRGLLWPPLVCFLKQVPADSKQIFFGWSWFSPVQSSLCPEKPLPVKHFLLYHLNLFLLLWFSQGPLCCFSQHALSPPSLCTITCHGTFLPLLSSRSVLYYVNFFHLSFNLPGSLIFVIAPLQGTWGLMCLLMVLLWATVKFIIFFKSKNNFNNQFFFTKAPSKINGCNPLVRAWSNPNREELPRLSKQQADKWHRFSKLPPCSSTQLADTCAEYTPWQNVQHSQAEASLINCSVVASPWR